MLLRSDHHFVVALVPKSKCVRMGRHATRRALVLICSRVGLEHERLSWSRSRLCVSVLCCSPGLNAARLHPAAALLSGSARARKGGEHTLIRLLCAFRREGILIHIRFEISSCLLMLGMGHFSHNRNYVPVELHASSG